MEAAEPLEFACPRCDKSPLEKTETGLRCSGCKVEYPDVGSIPWLFADPGAALAEWRGRLHFMLQALARDEQRLRRTLESGRLSELTATRIRALADATAGHAERLGALLAPLALDSLTTEPETYLALRTKLPADQGLLTYYGNLHRDWCWGGEENAASLAIVLDRLAGRAPGRTLVLGAGAGRLAYDFHENTGAPQTVALDFNPLLLLAASRITSGETIELYEFPLAPRDMAHQAVLRTLSAERPAREGLDYCLADAHRLPFPERSFDTVVTPWLVDILPEPFDRQAARINRLLADGGCWINFGSLSFHGADPAEQLTPEECVERIESAGFETPDRCDNEIPYLCSPASRHARRELVLSWAARKATHIRKLPRHEALPDWLVRGRDPVPQLEDFRVQAMSTRIHAFIMSLIDGRRSIVDMASVLEQQGLMTRREAEPAIRSFLVKMYEESQRRGRL